MSDWQKLIYAKSAGLNPDCFEEIRLLSKKYFNVLSYMIRSKILLHLEEDRLDNSFLCFICRVFLKINTMFPFFQSSRNIPQFKQFLNILKRSSIIASVAGHFQHANTDHIMTMSFSRIEFTDDSFNIIFHEFNVCQVLIGNGISWWGENTVIFNNWALFCKKRIKRDRLFYQNL